MKKLYQLVASGVMKNFPSSSGKISSGTVFTRKDKAEKYIEVFKDKCCNSSGTSSLMDLDPDEISIRVVELILDEEE